VTHPSRDLLDLAQRYGVATEFWDWRGQHRTISAETLQAVLGALGVDATSESAVHRALYEQWAGRWRRMLPPCLVSREGWTPWFWVHVTHGDAVEVWVELEGTNERRDVRQVDHLVQPQHLDGRLVGEATFALPGDLPLGYHTVVARSGAMLARSPLIVTPRWVGLPPEVAQRRAWGLALQLYSLTSARSWGVGDLADLADLAMWAGCDHGAGFLLVNPMHAAEPTPPMEPSPYLPTTRRFFNPLYLRVEAVPEFAFLPAADRQQVDTLLASARATLQHDTIDRDTVWAAKRAALDLVAAVPRSPGREIAYRAYVRDEGEGLDRFATWCALAETYGTDWREWPLELQQPTSPAVATFRAEQAEAVERHCWLQWLLDEQLAGSQAAARTAGMPIGIMHDLAVGVHPDGADTWGLQDVLASGITVGAPPDAFNQQGQDWSQPPWRPDRLAETGYAAFRDLVRTVLRHSGGLRVDHIIGLFRLWWIPPDAPPTEGTFVRYDHEALIGILALEAVRVGAVLVGEDLGTVEPWVRDYLRDRGILGTSILWFEYEEDGSPKTPERWRELCLATVTTHDLPPTAGYLAGEHVRLRDDLGLLARSLDEELAADTAERAAWLDILQARHLLPPNASTEQTVEALHRALTWSPCRLIGVSLSDAVGDRRTQNQPGTTDEYPNWRVPMTGPHGERVTVEHVVASERVAALARAVGGR